MGDIYSQVVDILLNHEADSAVITRQLKAERIRLDLDLERIMASVDIQGIAYDGDRVLSSPGGDGRMVSAIYECDRRRDEFAIATGRLEERLNQIKAVYYAVLDLPAPERSVLMALYYPRQTYRAAADLLGVDVATVARRRKDAVDALVKICEIKKIF